MTASAGPALKRLHNEYAAQVAFATLYVREAHPGDRYPQADTFDEKLAHARAYQQRDAIGWPVLVDDVTGTLHRTLDPKPNAAYGLDRDGVVVFRSLWSNHTRVLAHALRRLADEPPVPEGERETHVVPMLRGTGEMYRVLRASGPTATRDVATKAPPMYLSARVADLLRPLPALARGATGFGLVMALPAALWLAFARGKPDRGE